MNKSVLNSPRLLELKKKKHRILLKKIFFLIFLFILIFIGLSFLSKWKKLNISNIQISGNKIIETKMIEEVVKEKITGNYFWIFPKTNFIIYPENEIKKELFNKFKRLKNIVLNVQNFNILNISLVERIALYTYCGATPPESNNIEDPQNIINKCYFMDDSGYIFDEAPYFSGEVYLKFYGIANLYFFEPNFSKLISLKETLQKIGIKPVAFYLQDNGDIKIFLTSSTSQTGPEIILKSDSDFDQVIENLQSILATEPLKTDFKTKYSSLLYIDLRFGNKVYYKFK